jgi:PAS domain S-box-containing protein
MRFPIPLRLSIPIVLLLFGLVLGAFSLQRETAMSQSEIESEVKRFAASLGTQVSGKIEYHLSRNDSSGARLETSLTGTVPHLRHAIVLDDKNTVLNSSTYEFEGRRLADTPAALGSGTVERAREKMAAQLEVSLDRKTLVATFPFRLGLLPGEIRSSRVGALYLEFDLAHLKAQAYDAAINRSLAVGLFLAILCVLVWYYFNRTLTTRVARLVGVTRQLAEGDLDVIADLRGSDEISELSHAFDVMAAGIKERNQDIVAANQSLKQEILEHGRADQALRESESRFRAIADAMPIGVGITRISDDKIIYANEKLSRITGLPLSELKMGTAMNLYHDPCDREKIMSEFGREGSLRDREVEWKKPDGSPFWISLSAQKINLGGEACRLAGVVDITERKCAENALRESEERYRDLFENANDIIYTRDMDGRITSINRTAEIMTGYTRDELIGSLSSDAIAPEYRSLSEENQKKKLSGQATTTIYELEIVCKDGRKLPIEISTRLIYDKERPVGIQGIARNISERKQLEEQLRQSQKMESIGRLAGGIAHDFNNLLTAILGYCSIAARRLEPGNKLRADLAEIEKAGNRASELTSQLLAFSRRQVLQPKVIDLNSVVSDMEKLLRRLIGEDIEFTTRLDPDLGRVKADPGQIQQILMNLAVNARDAMIEGGRFQIETTNKKIDPSYAAQHPDVQPGHYVMIAVSDTGIGMDKETQSHIFEPFFTTKEQGKGTGLGLSTVYGITKQSGGHISVYSEIEHGTTFKVYLPRVDDNIESIHADSNRPETQVGTETILLVEDEDTVLDLVYKVLTMNGYKVLVASSATEAIELADSFPDEIDLLLSDVVMPKISGPELYKRLSIVRPRMKILFMSGYTDDSSFQRSLVDSETPFIQKPFTLDAFVGKVRSLLDADSETGTHDNS